MCLIHDPSRIGLCKSINVLREECEDFALFVLGPPFGYTAGERQLRQDLGLADEARLTLMRISAHTTAVQYAALIARYEATLREAVEVDVP
jgi:hypothetical protein